MNFQKINNKTTVIVTLIFVLFFLFTVLIVTKVLYTDNLKHKLIHIDSKVVGSRWIYYENK